MGVICGAGVNAAGIAPTAGPPGSRRSVRTPATGAAAAISGMAALGAAVRARDGRGPRTTLEALVPAHFGLARPIDVARAVEDGTITVAGIRELSPVIFARPVPATRRAGDPDRQADELATMAVAIVRRLHLTRRDVDVTLAGGVFRANDAVFEARIAAGVHAVVPAARLHRLGPPPVSGPRCSASIGCSATVSSRRRCSGRRGPPSE